MIDVFVRRANREVGEEQVNRLRAQGHSVRLNTSERFNPEQIDRGVEYVLHDGESPLVSSAYFVAGIRTEQFNLNGKPSPRTESHEKGEWAAAAVLEVLREPDSEEIRAPVSLPRDFGDDLPQQVPQAVQVTVVEPNPRYGYEVRPQSRGWFKLFGPDGEQVGKAQQSEAGAWAQLKRGGR